MPIKTPATDFQPLVGLCRQYISGKRMVHYGLFGVSRRHGTTLFALTVALTIGSNSLMATGILLKATPSSATLTCNTAATPPTTNIVITPVTALTNSSPSLAVTYAAAPAGVTVTPASGTLTFANQSIDFRRVGRSELHRRKRRIGHASVPAGWQPDQRRHCRADDQRAGHDSFRADCHAEFG